MNDIEKSMLKKQMVWLGISLAISLAIWFVCSLVFGDIGWLISMPITIGVFILLSIMINRKALRQGGFVSSAKGKGYVCYNCSTQYTGTQCPKCGAKGGKMVFTGEQ